MYFYSKMIFSRLGKSRYWNLQKACEVLNLSEYVYKDYSTCFIIFFYRNTLFIWQILIFSCVIQVSSTLIHRPVTHTQKVRRFSLIWLVDNVFFLHRPNKMWYKLGVQTWLYFSYNSTRTQGLYLFYIKVHLQFNCVQ